RRTGVHTPVTGSHSMTYTCRVPREPSSEPRPVEAVSPWLAAASRFLAAAETAPSAEISPAPPTFADLSVAFAVDIRPVLTWSGVRAGFAANISAATPETMAVACEEIGRAHV